MRVLSTVQFTALRMIRNYIVLLLLLILPMIILTFFSYILSGMVTETGVIPAHENAMQMVLVFQLFAGSIVTYMIHYDLISASNKLRMYVLPFNQTMYAYSIMMCGAVFSILLGVTLMVYAHFVLGVIWANWAWTIYIIALLATVSIIVCLIFTFALKNYKIAERLNDVYGVGFVILAGFFFPMPQHAVFEFLGSYGNPLTLAIGAVREMGQSNSTEAWLQANILLGAIIVLFIVMLVLGRRRMT